MKVYVIYDTLHERVREVHTNEDKAYERSNYLDSLWGNDYIYPHVTIEFELDEIEKQEEINE